MDQAKFDWPEPITPVQSLSESGTIKIPTRYIKPLEQRPSLTTEAEPNVNIPLIDLNDSDEAKIMHQVSEACKEWGFFQVLNHGVRPELMDRMRNIWREFFNLPLEIKKTYSNDPVTYEGYGSRVGVQKGAVLDWNDYFFLHYRPVSLKNVDKWPPSCRYVIEEYVSEAGKVFEKLMKILSISIGLHENMLHDALGGEEGYGATLRVNFFPKCPEPDLVLGLSPHSDPGGLTLLFPDHHVTGLQVRKDGKWVTVKPYPHAFVVNIGDQIQVLLGHKNMITSYHDKTSKFTDMKLDSN